MPRALTAGFLLFGVLFSLPAADLGGRAEYVGGTRADLPTGAAGNLEAQDDHYFVFWAKKAQLRILYNKINLLEYGQKVDRRYAAALILSPLFLLSKSRRHYLTIGYQDEDGRQQALVFRVDKHDVRAVLVSLEARTGLKVQFQDEEARKAGKG